VGDTEWSPSACERRHDAPADLVVQRVAARDKEAIKVALYQPRRLGAFHCFMQLWRRLEQVSFVAARFCTLALFATNGGSAPVQCVALIFFGGVINAATRDNAVGDLLL
jgi:hypothetical protein